MQENELFHQGYNAIALIGDFDGRQFNRRSIQPVDQGFDFYAPQTVLAPDGRRLMIGWMENWDYCKKTPRTHPWYGQMSLPREIHLQNGRLIQQPAREIEQYWQNTVCVKDTLVRNFQKYPQISGRALDMTLGFSPAEEACRSVTVTLAADDTRETRLTCDFVRKELIFDRRKSGGVPEAFALHRVAVPELDARCASDHPGPGKRGNLPERGRKSFFLSDFHPAGGPGHPLRRRWQALHAMHCSFVVARNKTWRKCIKFSVKIRWTFGMAYAIICRQ